MQFVKNRKGGDCLLYEGFIYRKHHQRGDKTYWICTKYDGEHCRGRCKSENGVVEVTNGDHNHTVDPSEADVRDRLAKMKSLASTTQELPCEIITKTVENASRSVAASLPSPC